MKRISVLVPTFNEERYIRQILESLALQSYQNFELIIKDGVSADNTLDIAREYADKIISTKDASIGDARNQGAKHAKGEVVVFLDADTSLDKNALEYINEDFTHHKIALLLPNARAWTQRRRNKDPFEKQKRHQQVPNKIRKLLENARGQILRRNVHAS